MVHASLQGGIVKPDYRSQLDCRVRRVVDLGLNYVSNGLPGIKKITVDNDRARNVGQAVANDPRSFEPIGDLQQTRVGKE